MRKRSDTIYAENEDEFKQLMRIQENTPKKKVKSKFSNNKYDNHFQDLNYSSTSIYVMSIKENSLEEQEKLEEENLSNDLHNLNLFYKERDPQEFFNTLTDLSKHSILNLMQTSCTKDKNRRPFSFNSIDNFNFDFDLINNSNNGNMTQNDYYSNVSTNDSNIESIIMQNLEIYEQVIKVMVIGDKCVGKSLLISKLLSQGNMNYLPTKNLEIYNKLFKIFGKFVKLELFDTCPSILNDSLMKIYFKLSNGFFLICDNEDLNSIKFVENQLNIIYNSFNYDKNVMLICNERRKITELKKKDLSLYKVCNTYLQELSDRYQLKVHFMNINDVTIEDTAFEKFFNLILIKKSKDFHKSIKKPLSKKKLCRVNSSSLLTAIQGEKIEKTTEKVERNTKLSTSECFIL